MRLRKKGQMGIGTLIIFISIILVAAIAAAVLLGTASNLQQRALTTGKQTEREVTAALNVVTIAATDGSDGDVESFEILVKLAAGSDPIALDNLIITLDTKNTTQHLEYTTNSSLVGTTYFGVEYIKSGPEHKDGYISRGDIAKITFNSSRSIEESEVIRIRMVPKHGVVMPIDIVTPDVMTTQRVILYP